MDDDNQKDLRDDESPVEDFDDDTMGEMDKEDFDDDSSDETDFDSDDAESY